jgi:hypothetical protein
MEIRDLTHEVWSGLVGESFSVRLDDGSAVELVLTAAEMGPGDPGRNGSAHSVIFTGPHDPLLYQRMWPLFHNSIGEHSLFMVPIGVDESGYQYEIVFTRAPSNGD